MLMLVGVSLALSGVFTFREAKTTLNPHTPEASTQMVNSGPFRFTRNPMYLGLVLLLLGVCVYLANPLTLIAVAALVTYLTRFQVLPEERRLLERFGEQYACYARTVRRWI
jgi:protein-S-isoprenylcysteine O-methyltransferase Ste14